MADTNLDFKNLPVATGVTLSDFVVLSLFGGTSSRISVGLFRSCIANGVAPSIGEDGYWYVGDVSTDVLAEGKTPEFRKSSSCIEFKYTTEDDTAWRPLIQYSDLRLRYDDLTEEQYDTFRLHYSDLTEEEIAELQQPANEMIAVLEATNNSISSAELVRQSNEEGRVQAEAQRIADEDVRVANEKERTANEEQRIAAESARRQAEDERASAELARKEEYAGIVNSLVTESMIFVVSEEEYDTALEAGTLDETKLYFAYEE